jgi:hypothetical protein
MATSAAADRRNDGALGTSGDVGLESGFADPLNDVLDLLRSGVVGHVHDHGNGLSIVFCKKSFVQKAKAAILSRLWWNLRAVFNYGLKDWLRFFTSAADGNQ